MEYGFLLSSHKQGEDELEDHGKAVASSLTEVNYPSVFEIEDCIAHLLGSIA